jgi:hypothetical protein
MIGSLSYDNLNPVAGRLQGQAKRGPQAASAYDRNELLLFPWAGFVWL